MLGTDKGHLEHSEGDPEGPRDLEAWFDVIAHSHPIGGIPIPMKPISKSVGMK